MLDLRPRGRLSRRGRRRKKPRMHGAVETDLGPAVRMLALATGTIGGFLTAVTVQILLWHTNVEIGAGWRDLFVDANAQMRSALAWWLIAGTALVSGFI